MCWRDATLVWNLDVCCFYYINVVVILLNVLLDIFCHKACVHFALLMFYCLTSHLSNLLVETGNTFYYSHSLCFFLFSALTCIYWKNYRYLLFREHDILGTLVDWFETIRKLITSQSSVRDVLGLDATKQSLKIYMMMS